MKKTENYSIYIEESRVSDHYYGIFKIFCSLNEIDINFSIVTDPTETPPYLVVWHSDTNLLTEEGFTMQEAEDLILKEAKLM